LEEGVCMTEREIVNHCQRTLENFMVPKVVEFRTELAKTTTGKIKKTELA